MNRDDTDPETLNDPANALEHFGVTPDPASCEQICRECGESILMEFSGNGNFEMEGVCKRCGTTYIWK